ncbi:MAG: riboflavin biosynthesis protein RibF [Actinomycetia bacterium]|nr:riboflavin biosynthesis protein RibF [Actinomycetes bacterium]
MRTLTWERGMACLGPAAVAIGVFDGVHLGHQALIRDTVERARAADVAAVVVTFDRDPDRVVSPETAAPQLLDLDDKLALIAEQGASAILLVPFDVEVAAMTPERFVREILLVAVRPILAAVGFDFRFGRYAAGDVATLTSLGSANSFRVIAHDLVTADGLPVTSTRVRGMVASGDVARAAQLLGRPHRLRGRVVRGRGLGTHLGVPTANLAVHHESAVPGDGVYAAFATVDGMRYPAAVSLGVPPTFPEAPAAIEAHLIGAATDFTGKAMLLEFIERLRGQRAFSSKDELTAAINRDIEAIRRLLG